MSIKINSLTVSPKSFSTFPVSPLHKDLSSLPPRPVVIFHHYPCVDGIAAASIALNFALLLPTPSIHLIALSYDDIPSLFPLSQHLNDLLSGSDVLIVDFSFPAVHLRSLSLICNSVLVIDHHKSACDQLVEFTATPVSGFNPDKWARANSHHLYPNVFYTFSFRASGALLTYEQLFPFTNVPPLIHRVSDRDLFTFHFQDTRYIHHFLANTIPTVEDLSVDSYFSFMHWLAQTYIPEFIVKEGMTIDNYHSSTLFPSIISSTLRFIKILKHEDIPTITCPPILASDCLHALYTDHCPNAPFVASFYPTNSRLNFSLRSRSPDGADVSAIAKQFGGGGHKHAAGFSIPIKPQSSLDLHLRYIQPKDEQEPSY